MSIYVVVVYAIFIGFFVIVSTALLISIENDLKNLKNDVEKLKEK